MDASLKLTCWEIQQEKKTKKTKIVGTYQVISGKKILANQKFNNEYNDQEELIFSDDLMKEISKVEEKISKEIETLL